MARTQKPVVKAPDIAALKRRQRSETILAKEGIPVDSSLPPVESEAGAPAHPVIDIAFRAMCLIAVAMKGEGRDTPTVLRLIREYGLAGRLSAQERAFIQSAAPVKRQSDRFSWRYEAAWTLLWALGYVDVLGRPDKPCDVQTLVASMRDRSAARFVGEASLRGMPQILDQADLVYRYHRAVISALIARKSPPAGLSPSVTHERHNALQWLIGPPERSWDKITADA